MRLRPSRLQAPSDDLGTPAPTAEVAGLDNRPGIRHGALAVAAVILQVMPAALPDTGWIRSGLPLASHVLVAVWLAANVWSARGHVLRLALGAAAVGWLMNMAVMLPNGGMPVDHGALVRVGEGATRVADGHLYKHVPAGNGTVLRFLGDIHPLPALRLVYSLGDVLLFAGLLATLAIVVIGNVSPRAGEQSRRPRVHRASQPLARRA